MVIFITGKAGAGKTTLANKLKTENTIIIDGDDFRHYFPKGYSEEDITTNVTNMGKTAAMLERQGFLVIVAAIMPKRNLRKFVRSFCQSSFLIYLEGGTMGVGTEYEIPGQEELCLIQS